MHRAVPFPRPKVTSARAHYFLPLSISHLSSLPSTLSSLSPAHESPQSSPFLVTLTFPPFSPSRTCVRARAPPDFFPVFTHRSFFPFRNIIGGAMHLSPFPSPPSDPPPSYSPASSGEDCARRRSRSLTPRVRLRRILRRTRAGNSLTRGCRRQEALIAPISLGLAA